MPVQQAQQRHSLYKVLSSQTLQPTIVASDRQTDQQARAETGAPSNLPECPSRCPSPSPISSTATPEDLDREYVAHAHDEKAKDDPVFHPDMPNTVPASVAPGRLATKYIAGNTAPVACSR